MVLPSTNCTNLAKDMKQNRYYEIRKHVLMLFLNFLLRVLFAKAGPFLFPGSQGVLQYSVPAPRGLFLKECKSPQFQVKY